MSSAVGPKKLMKVLIRIKDESKKRSSTRVHGRGGDGYKWAHLCYIPTSLYLRYFVGQRKPFDRLKHMIIHWVKQDFGVKVRLNTKQSVNELKQFITNMYKHEYKELFPKDGISFSKSGWFVLWLSKHMEMEIEEDEQDQE